jgi:hypothetical protein
MTENRRIFPAGIPAPQESVAFEDLYGEILDALEKENPAKDAPKRRGKRGRIAKSKARNLLGRIKNYKKDILKFMTDPAISFDNNLVERDIRMSKLHRRYRVVFVLMKAMKPLMISVVIFLPPVNRENPCLSQFMLQYRVTLYLQTKTLSSILMSKNNNILIFYCYTYFAIL